MKITTITHFTPIARRTVRSYIWVPPSITRFTAVKNRPCSWLSFSSSSAASAGVKVMALNTDRITANVIVMENC